MVICLSCTTAGAQFATQSWTFPGCSDPDPKNDTPADRTYLNDFNDPASLEGSIFSWPTNLNHLDIHGVTCAWDITQGSDDVLVGVIDGYFPVVHSEVVGDFFRDDAFNDCGTEPTATHGLQSVGVITAKINNNEATAGVCDEVRVRGYCIDSPTTYRNAHVRAFNDGARILSTSVRYGNDNLNLTEDVAKDLTENGMVMLKAVQGDYFNQIRHIPGVILVGRAGGNGRHDEYGSGNDLDTAIDVLVISSYMPRLESYDTNGTSITGGSSIGTPFAAGVVALMRSVNPCLPAAEVENILISTSQDKVHGDTSNLALVGGGVINAYEAVKAARDFEGTDETWSIGDFPVIQNRSVTGDLTVQSGHFSIQGNLYMMPGTKITVEAGATLFVNSGGSIRFGDDSGMVIKRGAKVELDNGTLTKSWCADKWAGVKVEGNINMPQPAGNNPSPDFFGAGVLLVKNNSVIEHAKNAVRMRGSGYSYPEAEEYFGGLIIAENSTFRHNDRSVEFMRYGDITNLDKSRFTNVTFDNHTDTDIENGDKFCVTNWRSDGVTFENCTFTNFDTGILTFNAAVVVTNGNSFVSAPYIDGQPLRRAISIENVSPSANAPVIGLESAVPNNFSGGYAGVEIIGQSSASEIRVINNNFSDEYFGLYIHGLSNYFIANNDFDNEYLGSVAIDTGNEINYHHANQFSNTFDALTAQGANGGYKFSDNCFDFNLGYDLKLNASQAGDLARIYWFQNGFSNTPNPGGTTARNNFSGPGNLLTSDGILMPANSSGFFYLAPSGFTTASNYYPQIDGGGLDNIEVIDFSEDDIPSCGSSGFTGSGDPTFSCNIPEDPELINVLVANLKAILAALAEPVTTEEKLEKAEYEKCLQLALNRMLKKYSETKDYANATLKFQGEDFDNKIKVYGMMLDYHELDLARNYLNALPTVSTEEDEFKIVQNIYIDLLEEGEMYGGEFTGEEVEERSNRYAVVKDIALKENRLSCYARSLWFLLTGERIRTKIERSEAEETVQSGTGNKMYSAYPNPTQDVLNVEMPKGNGIRKLCLTNLTGRQLIAAETDTANAVLNMNRCAAGVYFLTVTDTNGSLVWQTKIVKL